jgi:hypothetical protein
MGVTRTWTGCLGLLLLGVAVTACGDDDVNAVATTAASEEPVSGTLVVTCTADTTEVDGGTVAAGPDGVRVRVVDESGDGLQVRTEHDDPPVGSLSLAAGEATVGLPPGRNLLLCSTLDGPEHMLAPSQTEEAVEVEVEADPGVWKRPVLDCDLVSSSSIDFGDEPGSDGAHPADPMEAVRAAFPWLTDQDRIEKAGYPQNFDEPVQYRVQRDGADVVAVASVLQTDNGWVLNASEVCAEVQTPAR